MVISHFFFMPFYLVYHLFFMVNDLMVLPKTNLLTKTKKQKTQIWLYLFSHAAYKIGFILFYFIFLLGKWAHTYIFFSCFNPKKRTQIHTGRQSLTYQINHIREFLAREERWKTLHTRESRDIFSIVRVVIELRREKKMRISLSLESLSTYRVTEETLQILTHFNNCLWLSLSLTDPLKS